MITLLKLFFMQYLEWLSDGQLNYVAHNGFGIKTTVRESAT